MKTRNRKNLATWFVLLVLTGLFGISESLSAAAGNTFRWDAKKGRVTASFRDWPLEKVMSMIGKSSGWNVKVPVDSGVTVSGTFKDLPPHLALKHMFGHLNYAVFSSPKGGKPRLQIFLPAVESKEEQEAKAAAKAPSRATTRSNPFSRSREATQAKTNKAMERFDLDGDGTISTKERLAAIEALRKERGQK